MDLVGEGGRRGAVVSGLRWAADHETREKQEDGTVACSAAESHHTPEPGVRWSEYVPMPRSGGF